MDRGGDTVARPTLNAPRLTVGQMFQSRQDFTTAVKRQLLDEGRGWEVGRGGGRQAAIRCSGHTRDPVTRIHGGCGFRITACKQTRGSIDEWKVTSIVAEHVNCSMKGPPRGPGVAELRHAADAIVKGNPKITAEALQKTIKFQTGVDVHPRTANRLKRANLDVLADTRAQGFQYLGSYLDKLAALSGGTVTDVKWTDDGRFDKCFVMLGQSAHMAACSPQQVFSTDCCHLKGHWNGVICLLSVNDANNKIVIVAFAVAHFENADTYKYMFSNIKKNEELAAWINKETTTYFVDCHKGSAAGIPAEVPKAEERRCLRHLISHVTPNVGEECMEHIFSAARASSSAMFNYYMDKVKLLKPASYSSIMKNPPSLWTNYASRNNVIWDQVSTNLSESANSVIGDELRAKPVFELVKGIVDLMATRLYEASQLNVGTPEVFTPFAEGCFSTEHSWSRQLVVKTSSPGSYTVAPLTGDWRLENGVRLTWAEGNEASSMRCTCGYPVRWEMPCRHIIAVCEATNKLHEARTLIGNGFKLANYRAIAFTPSLTIEKPVWSELTRDTTRKEPMQVKQAGQAKKGRKTIERIPSVGEFATPKYNTPLSTSTRSTSGVESQGAESTPAGSQTIDLSQD